MTKPLCHKSKLLPLYHILRAPGVILGFSSCDLYEIHTGPGTTACFFQVRELTPKETRGLTSRRIRPGLVLARASSGLTPAPQPVPVKRCSTEQGLAVPKWAFLRTHMPRFWLLACRRCPVNISWQNRQGKNSENSFNIHKGGYFLYLPLCPTAPLVRVGITPYLLAEFTALRTRCGHEGKGADFWPLGKRNRKCSDDKTRGIRTVHPDRN